MKLNFLKLLFVIGLFQCIAQYTFSQSTSSSNNYNGGYFLGWNGGNQPLQIRHDGNSYLDMYTSGVHRVRVTTGNILSGVTGGPGDGISIQRKPVGQCSYTSLPGSSIDLWTSCSDGTNIRWGYSGQISGANSQFQQWGNYNGFWFNAYGTGVYQPRYIFNTLGVEHARAGLNRFWRFGANPSNNDAVRRVEVYDNSGSPQFRLTANPNSATFTDFKARNNGSLNILPSGAGRVAINLNANPSHNLEVNGDARIRNIPVDVPNCLIVGTNQTSTNDNQLSRLDFTGNANQVLLGNGTWGNAPTSGIGNYCGNTLNALTGDYQIPLASNDFYFTDFGASPFQNRVSIGLPCPAALASKLTVNQNNTVVVSVSTSAIRGLNENEGTTGTTKTFRGVWGIAFGTDNFKNNRIGGDFRGFTNGNFGFNIGVRGNAGTLPTFQLGTAYHIGGLFYSNSNYTVGNNISIGVAGIAEGGTLSNIGVYGQAPDLTTTAGPDFAGYFNGDVLYTGQVSTSDAMFKYNIDSIQNALVIIDQLKPKSYFYDATAFQGKMKFSTKQQYGFIAQDVEQILPELVGTAIQPGRVDTLGNVIFNDFSFKTLNYQGLFAILTKGIQEQNSIIDNLERQLSEQDSINNALYNMITACCSNNSNMGNNAMQNQNNQNNQNTLDVTLNDAPSIVLDQNVPNPFAEQTTITYTLVDGVQKAQMLFYNIEGKLIQSVNLTPAGGKGQINVFANDLSTGIYTYTLVVDGEIKGTKRMVKE